MAVILGIDPGSRKCGYGLISAQGSRLSCLACGVIRVESLPFNERLKVIHDQLGAVIEEYQPQEAAVEEVFVGRSAASALKLGHARGVAILACTGHDLPVHEYAARKVKQCITGTGRAEKAQMQHMIKALLQLSAEPSEDAADALSVAVCHAHTVASLVRMAGVRGSRGRRLL